MALSALWHASIVMCATGNLALRRDDFARLANGAYLAFVTSSGDEAEILAASRDLLATMSNLATMGCLRLTGG